ncbi:WD repeat-containing protein WRAP73 [Biomphalaria pfeifferi]|uniref:WD repeat-containing protein WRAP73 n=1 Tax=Biomphalaria pfeifferi TaxID=112525 RepID=A0AAD8EVU2_BIOPF|nr:WD repeat-containing protein WRAP73 [Biomphalaria pfeifferi]
MFKRGLVQVWSLEVPDWHCKIDEGSAGLSSVVWSPDGRHILTTADFNLRITVWSLVTKSVSYIRYPKQCDKALDFSKNGKFMALAERRDCKDHISIFSCQAWSLVRHFESETDDLGGLQWSPDSRVLCVWDSCFTYKVLLYSLDGRCLSKFSAYDLALGIKALTWSPTSQFLAIGSYDEKVRVLNHITWKTVATFSHPETIDSKTVIVYKEIESKTPSAPVNLSDIPTSTLFTPTSKYEVQQCPLEIPITKPALNKANPKIGVGSLAFSYDNKFMFTKNDNMPCVLWIWDIRKLGLCAVLLQTNPIKAVKWDPCSQRLALCTSTNKLYMWSPSGCLSVQVPVEGTFLIHNLSWQPEGDAILLVGKEQMCVCYLSPTAANASAAHNISAIESTQDGNKGKKETSSTNGRRDFSQK